MASPHLAYVRFAALVGAVEAAALVIFCLATGISATHSSGSAGASAAAPIVLIAIYLIFALGIGLVARGLWRDSKNARAPFLLIQVFGLVIAFTLFAGGSPLDYAFGVLVLVAAIVGIAVMIIAIVKMPDEGLRRNKPVENSAPSDETSNPT